MIATEMGIATMELVSAIPAGMELVAQPDLAPTIVATLVIATMEPVIVMLDTLELIAPFEHVLESVRTTENA
jgi:hypothetical protein